LGSNIEPQQNLEAALHRLREYGQVIEVSSVWESHALGADGPNFLNACVGYAAAVTHDELKKNVVDSIEIILGRARTTDKNAPRTIDIDIIMEGYQPLNLERWSHVFVVVPMAELLPDLLHPTSGLALSQEAANARASTWIRRRPGVLRPRANDS
jgi:2-amino-4-hydroxy-6-hydroxymethyldihydropteridine diphosphokinase